MQMRFAFVASAIVLVCADLHAQQAFTIEQLLDRATSYVEDLVAKLSRVVAEEQYVQEYLLSGIEGSRGSFLGSPKVAERRRLVGDLLLVKPSESEPWHVFRDVFEVDGRPVRDRENRLAKLFLGSKDTAGAVVRAREIAAESARFNIRPIGTVDNPLLALGLLQRAYRPRFRFTLRGRDVAVGPDVWIIEFRETVRPTLMRGTGDKDIFARGRYWVDAGSGSIARTEVVFSALGTESSVMTSFEVDERLGTPVPVEMRFKRGSSRNEVRGVATYGRFRQFEVGTEETIQK
jgi:hypothetical protein